MKKNVFLLLMYGLSLAIGQVHGQTNPIALHPQNPHYFIYQGKATALITSAEHYGAVLNLDFDYKKYLKTLADEGMNYTRIFTGTYYEIEGDFGIEKNNLAPKPDRYLGPWQKAGANGMKFDLSKWNEAYFARLKDFLEEARKHNVIVEITLFSSIYQDKTWGISPQNPANNVNLTDSIPRQKAQTLDNNGLWSYQEGFVKKIVTEVNSFDNIFFEVQNEPWSDRTVSVYNIINKEELVKNDWTNKADFADEASLQWQAAVAHTITQAEQKLAKKHLIAQNYTNYRASIPDVAPNISIINFHYAWPEAVQWNYHYPKVIGFDESGFAGSDDAVYRRQAWQFMLSGGGLFNSLDYSFSVGDEDGKGTYKAPGGGSTALRAQLKILADFLHSYDLENLRPNYGSTLAAPGLIAYTLSDKSQAFAVFLRATGAVKSTLKIAADKGTYSVKTLDTVSGQYTDLGELKSMAGVLTIPIDIPAGELALQVWRR
jgi:hypothetical protein